MFFSVFLLLFVTVQLKKKHIMGYQRNRLERSQYDFEWE